MSDRYQAQAQAEWSQARRKALWLQLRTGLNHKNINSNLLLYPKLTGRHSV
jgi:hypothetical protein